MTASPESLLPADIVALARRVVAENRAAGRTVVLAESCTGGLVCAALTEIAGSSAVLDRGFVTYSNEAKTELLGVPTAVLAAHGAVSRPVAEAMAEGALARSNAELAVSITGIAGPGGATPGKPVGTVWFAWADRSGRHHSLLARFDGDRRQVRQQAVRQALSGLLALLR